MLQIDAMTQADVEDAPRQAAALVRQLVRAHDELRLAVMDDRDGIRPRGQRILRILDIGVLAGHVGLSFSSHRGPLPPLVHDSASVRSFIPTPTYGREE